MYAHPLSVRGSSRRFSNVDYVLPGVPRAVVDSWDWCMRTDADLVRSRSRRGGGFVHLLHARLQALRPFRVFVDPRLGADLAYVRHAREVGWIRNIAETAANDRDATRGPVEASDRWLFCDQAQVMSGRQDRAHWAPGAHLDPEWSMPRSSREYETRQRHRLQFFVPDFCKEANWLDRHRLHERYVALPDWWDGYELPYGLRAETPRVVAYFTRRLITDDRDVMWSVLRSEWAAEAMKEVLLAARAGRMYWLPEYVRDDVSAITIASIFRRCAEDVVDDALALFDFIRRADWSRCPAENRSLPEQATRFSPVFRDTGDFFDFHVEEWRPIDAPLRAVDAHGEVVGPGGGRGSRYVGPTVGMPTRNCPSGHSRGVNAVYPSAQERRAGGAGRLTERGSARRRLNDGSASGSSVTPNSLSHDGEVTPGVDIAPGTSGGVFVSVPEGATGPPTGAEEEVGVGGMAARDAEMRDAGNGGPAPAPGSAAVDGRAVESVVPGPRRPDEVEAADSDQGAGGGDRHAAEQAAVEAGGRATEATSGSDGRSVGAVGARGGDACGGADGQADVAVRPSVGCTVDGAAVASVEGREHGVDAQPGVENCRQSGQGAEAVDGAVAGGPATDSALGGGAGEAPADPVVVDGDKTLAKRTASLTLGPSRRDGVRERDKSPAGRAGVEPVVAVRKSPRLASKKRG